MAPSRQPYFFWQILSRKSLKRGFEVNPYDWYNKMINRKQCIVLWHVDEIKISHGDKNVVTKVLDLLSDEFGKEAPMTITRGKNHQHLSSRWITPTESNMLSELPPDMDRVVTNHMFSVNQESQKLNKCSTTMWPSCCSYANNSALIFRQLWIF